MLDEEDDGCHCWYCQKGIGASCSSPDSWCRRCNLVNASLKSEQLFIGPIFPDLLRDPPILFVSKVLIYRHSFGEIFLRLLVHLDADFFSSINADLRFTKYGIFLEANVNPFKSYLDASRDGRCSGPFVLPDGHEVAFSYRHSSGLREDPLTIGGYFGWIDSLSRDARKCSRRCLVSSKESILCIAI